MTFPNNLIEKLALQQYIDAARPIFQNNVSDWRPDVNAWFSLSEAEKNLWRDKATQWLTDWNNKYTGSIDYILENWVDLDFSIPPS